MRVDLLDTLFQLLSLFYPFANIFVYINYWSFAYIMIVYAQPKDRWFAWRKQASSFYNCALQLKWNFSF